MAFKIEGKEGTFPTMLAVAAELGRARIYRKDFEKFGVEEVQEAVIVEAQDVNETVEEAGQVEVATPTDEIEQEEVEETPTEDAGLDKDDALDKVNLTEDPKEPKAKKAKKEKTPKAEPTEEMLAKAEELQQLIGFTEIYDWAVAMKKTKTDDVLKMAEAVGATWNVSEVERVNRMRMVMAIRELVFPGQKRPKVNRSAWRGVEFEVLVKLAEENEIAIPDFADARIKRMRLIQELKKAGIQSPATT